MKRINKHQLKKKFLLLCSAIGLGIGVALGVLLPQHAPTLNSVTAFDITYIDSKQAMVFWKTKKPSIGYVRSGTNKFRRSTIVPQTSSEANEIHAVLLENLPLEGVYISVHTEDEPWYQFATVHLVAPSLASDTLEELE